MDQVCDAPLLLVDTKHCLFEYFLGETKHKFDMDLPKFISACTSSVAELVFLASTKHLHFFQEKLPAIFSATNFRISTFGDTMTTASRRVFLVSHDPAKFQRKCNIESASFLVLFSPAFLDAKRKH
jgi:hypothetical protein